MPTSRHDADRCGSLLASPVDPRLRGDHLRVPLPVPLGPLVLPPPDGTGGDATQHAAGAPDRAVQADGAAGHDRAPVLRPQGDGGGGGPCPRAGHPGKRGLRAGPPLCARDRAQLLGHRLFRLRHAGRALAQPDALHRAAGTGGCEDRQDRTQGDDHLRDEPPLEHGLRAGHLARRQSLGPVLRGGRVGADLAAVGPDPGDRGLLHPPQLAHRALPPGAGALCADGDGRRHDAGDLSRRRPEPERPGRAGQAGPARLYRAGGGGRGARRGLRAGGPCL